MLSKNFTYGDFWPGKEIAQATEERPRELVSPEKITNNSKFIEYLQKHNYSVYLDYNYAGYAHTSPGEKEVVLNGNYSDEIISSFLQHEMGHLVLFSDAKFSASTNGTLSGLLASEIYSVKNIEDYGVETLLRVENVLQDIVIETLSGDTCICNVNLRTYGYPICVKHIETLENIKHIAKTGTINALKSAQQQDDLFLEYLQLLILKTKIETDRVLKGDKYEKDEIVQLECLLKNQDIVEEEYNTFAKVKKYFTETEYEILEKVFSLKPRYSANIRPVLISMIDNVKDEIGQLVSKIEIAESSNDFKFQVLYGNTFKVRKLSQKLSTIDRRLQKGVAVSFKLLSLKNEIEGEIELRSSRDYRVTLEEEAELKKTTELKMLGRKLKKSEDLLKAFQKELFKVSDKEENGAGSTQKGGETFGKKGDEKMEGLIKNTTDHLSDPHAENNDSQAHSYDCGFPHPIAIDRNDDAQVNKPFNAFKQFDTGRRTRKIKLSELDLADIDGAGSKSIEKEITYFKTSKREWDQTDMLQGKRKKKKTGIGVLIGLDISGSMNSNWITKFVELTTLVENFKKDLDIENIHYFTYNTKVYEHSNELKDLTLKTRGGNAFSYVYQDIMKKLPILERNEIILVTDCGDNLGFDLDANCTAERNGNIVKNHISIVDTDAAAFYNESDLHEQDWSIHRSSDLDLAHNISENLEKLINS